MDSGPDNDTKERTAHAFLRVSEDDNEEVQQSHSTDLDVLRIEPHSHKIANKWNYDH